MAAGIDHLAALDGAAGPARVVAIGHSAGGTLALWAASRRDAVVPLAAVVAQAPPTDLEARARAGGQPAAPVRALLGGPPEAAPERYRAASPAGAAAPRRPVPRRPGRGRPMVDPAGSRRYVEAARAGGDRPRSSCARATTTASTSTPCSVAGHAALAWLEPWGP